METDIENNKMFPAVHNHISTSNWRKEWNFEPRSLSDWTEKTFVVKYHSRFAFENDSTGTIISIDSNHATESLDSI